MIRCASLHIVLLLVLVLIHFCGPAVAADVPNIIVIMADDKYDDHGGK